MIQVELLSLSGPGEDEAEFYPMVPDSPASGPVYENLLDLI